VYLLDTNHCSKILSGHSGISRKLKSLGDVLVATCVVVRGELVYMAEKSANPSDNRETVAHFLDDIEVFPIDEKTANVYGKLKAALVARFGPREKAKLRRIEIAICDLKARAQQNLPPMIDKPDKILASETE